MQHNASSYRLGSFLASQQRVQRSPIFGLKCSSKGSRSSGNRSSSAISRSSSSSRIHASSARRDLSLSSGLTVLERVTCAAMFVLPISEGLYR